MSNTKVSSEQIIDNVALGGNPTTTTQSASDNSTKVATTAYVTTAISDLVDSSPSALNTLNELAAALGDDANFSTTVTNSIALKAPLASPDFTGQVQVTNSATTVQEFIVTGNNTRSALSMQSKDTSGNAVDLRMHSLGDGPRGEIFTFTNHDLAFATNNAAPQLTLKTNGNLGLGTGTNVDELLHLEKTSGTTIVKTEVAANSIVGFEIQKTGSTTSNWRIVDGQTVNGSLEIYDVTDSRQVMVFDGDGDIGMGVSPASNAKLTIGGTTTSYSSVLAFDNNTTGGATFFMLASDNTWSAGGNKFLMGHGSPSSAAVDVTIDADGFVGIGDTSPARALSTKSSSVTVGSFESTSSSGGMISFVDSNTTNDVHVRVGSLGDNLVLQAGGSTKMTVLSGGNVGISETNPVAKLAIKGANDTNFEIQPDLSNGVNRITNFNRVTSAYKKLRIDASEHEFYISGNPRLTLDSDIMHVKSREKYTVDGATYGRVIIRFNATTSGDKLTAITANLNTLLGFSTGDYGQWTVEFGGYAGSGTNGCTGSFTIGGYTGHSYSATNHNSYGAGTINVGYDSSGGASTGVGPLSYHPVQNNGMYIASGEVWVYVPAAQQVGIMIKNNGSQNLAGTMTVTATVRG